MKCFRGISNKQNDQNYQQVQLFQSAKIQDENLNVNSSMFIREVYNKAKFGKQIDKDELLKDLQESLRMQSQFVPFKIIKLEVQQKQNYLRNKFESVVQESQAGGSYLNSNMNSCKISKLDFSPKKGQIQNLNAKVAQQNQEKAGLLSQRNINNDIKIQYFSKQNRSNTRLQSGESISPMKINIQYKDQAQSQAYNQQINVKKYQEGGDGGGSNRPLLFSQQLQQNLASFNQTNAINIIQNQNSKFYNKKESMHTQNYFGNFSVSKQRNQKQNQQQILQSQSKPNQSNQEIQQNANNLIQQQQLQQQPNYQFQQGIGGGGTFSSFQSSQVINQNIQIQQTPYQQVALNPTTYQQDIANQISAQAWSIINLKNGKIMASKFDLTKREIASLTKIMTLWVCLQLIEKFSIDPEKEIVTVSDQASCQGGTTANLFEGDKLTVWDCFHALMLPSGNDAAVALSEHFGNILLKNSTFSKKNFINLNNSNSENTPYKVFLDEMNKYAKELNMVYTFYANPHGLQNNLAKSNVKDQIIIAQKIIQDKMAQQIINTQFYQCQIQDEINQNRQVSWENTNYLLQVPGFKGVKTGITNTAGPCLISWYCDKGIEVMIILLGSKSMESRWFETVKSVNWAAKKILNLKTNLISIQKYLGSEDEFYY